MKETFSRVRRMTCILPGLVALPLAGDMPTVTVEPEFSVQRIIHSGPFQLGEFDRDVYFRSYHPPGKFSEERNRELRSIGATPGRGSYNIDLPEPPDDVAGITEAMAEGRVHPPHFPEKRYVDIYGRMGEEVGKLPHALAHGGYPNWMRTEFDRTNLEGPREDWEQISYGNVPRKDLYEPLADGVVRMFQHWKEEGVPYPRYYTVQNEPIWRWETSDLAEFHNLVVRRMQEEHPEVLVGGPCYAWPYPGADWSGWKNPSSFIELSGGELGFYDLHFYSKGDWSLPQTPEWQARRVEHPSLYRSQRLGVGTVWDFGRLEGYLDLWNAHHLQVWDGVWKPMVVSEFGRQGIHPQFGPWTNDFKPFLFMNTVVRMWMTFMERPDIQLTVPFILGESDLPYVPRRGMAVYTRPRAAHSEEFLELARRRGQGVMEVDPDEDDPSLERTRFYDFYNFLSDIRGHRIPVKSKSEDPAVSNRVFVRGFRDGANGYLWIHNGGAYPDHPVRVNLASIFEGEGETVVRVGVKRLYFDGPVPDPAETGGIDGHLHIDEPDGYRPLFGNFLEMAGEETAVIRVEFRAEPLSKGVAHEHNRFAAETVQSFENGRSASLSFSLEAERVEAAKDVDLHLGFARDGGFTDSARIMVNGEAAGTIDLSGSEGIENFHRIETLRMPGALLRSGENRVEVTLTEEVSGGEARLVSGRMTLHSFQTHSVRQTGESNESGND
jgi:hypothetical protein